MDMAKQRGPTVRQGRSPLPYFRAVYQPAAPGVRPRLTDRMKRLCLDYLIHEAHLIIGLQALKERCSSVFCGRDAELLLKIGQFCPFYAKLVWRVAGYVTFDVRFAASENGYEVESTNRDLKSASGHVTGCLTLERV